VSVNGSSAGLLTMLSPDVQDAINRAFAVARDARHAVVSVDHVLLSMLAVPAAAQLLEERGMELHALRSEVENAVARTPLQDESTDVEAPTPTTALQRAIQVAILRAQKEYAVRVQKGSLRMESTAADLLDALLQAR
jgi:ATP-dependent Clp protease ATP-binding subunit ClpA